MKVLKLFCSEIKPNPNQPRKSLRGIEGLADNIKLIGQLNPITVEKTGVKEYQIIGGERRWTAFTKVLKWPKIWAFIRKPGPYEMLADNMAREELSLLEKTEAATSILKKQFGLDYKKNLGRLHSHSKLFEKEQEMKKACKSMGIHPSTLYINLPVLDLPNSVKKMIIENPDYFPHSVVLKLARLKNKEQQIDCTQSITSHQYDARDAMRHIYKVSFGETDGEILQSIENFYKSYFSVLKKLNDLLLSGKIPKVHERNFFKKVNSLREKCGEVLREIPRRA